MLYTKLDVDGARADLKRSSVDVALPVKIECATAPLPVLVL
jgi:hypothetical protein